MDMTMQPKKTRNSIAKQAAAEVGTVRAVACFARRDGGAIDRWTHQSQGI
jgi:hypothetical protein